MVELETIKVMSSDQTVFNGGGFIEAEKRGGETGKLEAISPVIFSANSFYSKFVFNDDRYSLFEGFCKWLQLLDQRNVKIMTVWFVGSYIEQKAQPPDIDCLIFYADDHEPDKKPEYLQASYCVEKFGVDVRAISMKQNPVNVIHQVAQYTLYYSHPSNAKRGRYKPFRRRAIISVIGPELTKFSHLGDRK